MGVLDHAFDHPMKLEEHATMSLAGGLISYGYQCGMLWGAALAAGAQAYRVFGPGPEAEARTMIAAQKIVESFRALNKDAIDCADITDTNWQKQKEIFMYLLKGGVVTCIRMAARYSPIAFDTMNTALADASSEVSSLPISCSALLAQRMGASEMHKTMAAGFAGGIGLSGGACGALGAAIWIIGMKHEKLGFRDIKLMVADTIDAVSAITDSKLECTEIAGRRFKDVGDHAAYLRSGGCSEIIEVLVNKTR
jgi:hypothetical protein